ncbi:MAG: peptidyl-prolyl cis-trans isomerase [Chloroherpetonaceae bacterium]|nr:peptidyl-prolyl cis-trans isomerase [Chthonomonadaceae bacterium]MDW8208352.1 peptidyl-prolyl cis-trans isomerase [Chloroherpetonaceae bacterium]
MIIRRCSSFWALASILTSLEMCPVQAQDFSNTIIATVNGQAITQGEFLNRLQRLRAQDFIISLNPLAVRTESAGIIVLNALINERLIVQWATKTNQMPSEEEVNTALENLRRQPNVVQALTSGELTEEILRHEIRVQRAHFNIATTAISVTPAEVEAFYKRNIASFTQPERWTVAALRLTRPDNLAKIQADLKAGKSFTDVVKTYGEDEATRKNAGQTTVIAANNPVLPEEIRKAITAMKVGDVSAPIKIEYPLGANQTKVANWWIVRLVGKEPAKPIPFSEVKEQAERAAILEKAGGMKEADRKITTFRAQSVIKIMIPGYKSLENTPKSP